jgi:hypothetical protein
MESLERHQAFTSIYTLLYTQLEVAKKDRVLVRDQQAEVIGEM